MVGSIFKAPVPVMPLVAGTVLCVKFKVVGVAVGDKLVVPV